MSHVPVLLNEVIKLLEPKPGEIVIDATLGGAGHARALLRAVGPRGFLLGIDADPKNAERFNKEFKGNNAKAVAANLRYLQETAFDQSVKKADIVLFDFGMSSDQLDDPRRGFSFQKEGPLDMRFNQKAKLTAADIVNAYSESALVNIFREYGEEKNAKKIARAIVGRRVGGNINTTTELFETIKTALPANIRFRAGDTARKIFQALRITVNDELASIGEGLASGFKILSANGRMAAISFHSLEDRIVKHFFADLARNCICPPEFPVCRCSQRARAAILTPKPIMPSKTEQADNPRSKSAKLRAIKKFN